MSKTEEVTEVTEVIDKITGYIEQRVLPSIEKLTDLNAVDGAKNATLFQDDKTSTHAALKDVAESLEELVKMSKSLQSRSQPDAPQHQTAPKHVK